MIALLLVQRFVNSIAFRTDRLHNLSFLIFLVLIYLQYKDVWFHSHRQGVTIRPYALNEDQKINFVHFLRAAKPDDNLLPILGNETNRRRVDAEIAIAEHDIYRDRWERKIERYNYSDYVRRQRDVIDRLDYLDLPRLTRRGFIP